MQKNVVGTDVNQVRLMNLTDIHGQPQVVNKLKVDIRAYFNMRSTGESSSSPFGPVILSGPVGCGKTTVAKVLHAELGNLNLIETNGVIVNNKAERNSILLDADENTTIFIDECQALNIKTQQILLTALTERTLRVPAGTSHYHTIPLANFTMVMATTHEYLLLPALIERMRIHCRFKDYSVEDIAEIVRQRLRCLNWQCESDEVLQIIAKRAKRNPRQALHRNLQMCWHVTKSRDCDRNVISIEDTHAAFCYLQIDELGLNPLDRNYLTMLHEYGQSTLGVLSAKLSLPPLTIQRVVEPYLLKENFIIKDKSSVRVITQKGRKHIESTSFPSN
ncbi:MAG: AAA family ATPase [Candidatus Bathyarchaeota archaeon]|nr:MAG: AAA family ATPase [Candidatus Bathyarchaeota archaeon]